MSQIRSFEVINFRTIKTAGGTKTADTAVLKEIGGNYKASAISYLYRGRECHCNDFKFKMGMKISTNQEIKTTTGRDGKIYNKIGTFVLISEAQDVYGTASINNVEKPVIETKAPIVDQEPVVKIVKVKSSVTVTPESHAALPEEEDEVSVDHCEAIALSNGWSDIRGGRESFFRKKYLDDDTRSKKHKNTRRHGRGDKWAESFMANCYYED